MSQAKVDRYKEEKRNRKKIMAKEKRNWFFTQLFLIAIGVAIVVWVVIAGYQAFTSSSSTSTTPVEMKTYTLDNSAIEDYLTSLEEL